MKIALATADFPPIEGGLSRLSTDLARELHRAGRLSGVLAPKLPDADTHDRTLDYPVFRFPGYNAGPARLLPGFLATGGFRRQVLSRSDHLLAINPSFGGAYGLLVHKQGIETPFSVFAYGYEFLKFELPKPSSVGKRVLLEIYREAHAILAISRFTRDQVIEFGVPTEKVRLCPLGVDLDRFQPDRTEGLAGERLGVLDGGPILLTVGRLVSRKRHRLVIQAVKSLRDRWPGIEYWIVGRGPEEEALRKLTKRENLEDHIRFWGKTDEEALHLFYQACDVFLLPAIQDGPSVEGLGLVLQEAAACGKPTIGAESGGVPEAMLPGKTGLMVPPDNLEALIQAIGALLEDPDRRVEMGRAGLDWVRRERNWKVCIQGILAALEG
ncbi:MAG: GDP-mannose-dependent alpha-(1-6)-phosphatidylinositol monomannoside mannosyltransferase [bacterium]|nr:GDP-mannose-dependent alpha-(1-6)-phosphatidylinositol monomannoside mannosyltransferase [bacterium]